MAKQACKERPSKSGLDVEIEAEGFAVFVGLRDQKTGENVQIKLHRRAAAALHALLGACDGSAEDAGAMAVTLRGEMTLTPGRHHAEPPTVPPVE